MPEETTGFVVDKTNLMKAGTVPVIAAAVAGALWLLGFLGGLMGLVFWALAGFAGYWFACLALKAEPRPPIAHVTIHGAILGVATGLAYAIVSWIAISIRWSHFAMYAGYFDLGSVLSTGLQAGIGGAIGAALWYAYKTGMIKTT